MHYMFLFFSAAVTCSLVAASTSSREWGPSVCAVQEDGVLVPRGSGSGLPTGAAEGKKGELLPLPGQGGLEVKILPLLATASFVVVASYERFISKFHSPSQDLGRFWLSVSMSAVVLPPMGDHSCGHVMSSGEGLPAVGSCSSADVWAK